jgi:aryl-alcohol dehydrogenase-like predicted oxidoreductase
MFAALRDERRIDAVERFIPLADEAGIPLTHLALAFVIAHPGVTAALIGPRTGEQLDDLLAAAEVELSDDLLDRIDEIVPPGTGVGRMDQEYSTPPIVDASLRRRPPAERAAA